MNTSDQSTLFPEYKNPIRDERNEILSVPAAAKLLGLQRTQAWRLASEGKIPVIVLGTARRPVHYFRRADVVEYRRRKDEARAERRKHNRCRSQKALRRLLSLL